MGLWEKKRILPRCVSGTVPKASEKGNLQELELEKQIEATESFSRNANSKMPWLVFETILSPSESRI